MKLQNLQNSALIVVDYQNDFADPKGALYVQGWEQISQQLSSLLDSFKEAWQLVVATKDWHPADHMSFASTNWVSPFTLVWDNMKWPDHCVQDQWWSQLQSPLQDNDFDQMILKAYKSEEDSYSGFQGTFLNEYLRSKWIKNVFVAGLATDFCIKFTALDSVKLWYETFVVNDAIKSVFPENDPSNFEEMKTAGIVRISSEEIIKVLKKIAQ